jgi:raffinose synthase
LTNIKENHKFQKDGKEVHGVEDPTLGLRHIVGEIKDKHALKYDSLIYIFISFAATLFYKIFMIFIFGIARYVYVLHAITGYWAGVKPGVTEMEHYESKLAYPVSSPRVVSNEACDSLKSITANGLGLVNPKKVLNFYNEQHSYLASAGIDGVKVDVQNILETLYLFQKFNIYLFNNLDIKSILQYIYIYIYIYIC